MPISSTHFGLALNAVYYDPDYDPFSLPPEPNENVDVRDEGLYYQTAGITDGKTGNINRSGSVPQQFAKDYLEGYNMGAWWYKIFHYLS